jgi:hypothetical protein
MPDEQSKPAEQSTPARQNHAGLAKISRPSLRVKAVTVTDSDVSHDPDQCQLVSDASNMGMHPKHAG